MTARGRGQSALGRASWTERARYRIAQFRNGWRAAVTAQDSALMEQVLSPIGPEAARLFRRMPVDAQAHSLRVLKFLQAGGPTSHDLAAAALLHDVGKVAADDAGAYLGLWIRGPLVLLGVWRPQLLARLSSPEPSASLRYALYVHSQHPQIGAAWARQAGCSALTCWLIAHHQEKTTAAVAGVTEQVTGVRNAMTSDNPFDQTTARHCLARLQWADGRN